MAAIVSDDGTRCAAECPHRDGGYGHCTAFDKPLVLDLGHGAYDRCPTCISAEQAAASSGHLDGGARALDASEALARARRDGIRAGYRIARRRDTPADEDAALAEMHEETAFASEYVSRAVAAIEARHAEALREARVQGMREALSIAKSNAYATVYDTVDWSHVDEVFRAAIEAVRKGER